MRLNNFTHEQIVGMCEANEFYNFLSQNDKNKIPKKFIDIIQKYSNYKLGAKINSISDISEKYLSREGLKNIAYMCLFLKSN